MMFFRPLLLLAAASLAAADFVVYENGKLAPGWRPAHSGPSDELDLKGNTIRLFTGAFDLFTLSNPDFADGKDFSGFRFDVKLNQDKLFEVCCPEGVSVALQGKI